MAKEMTVEEAEHMLDTLEKMEDFGSCYCHFESPCDKCKFETEFGVELSEELIDELFQIID